MPSARSTKGGRGTPWRKGFRHAVLVRFLCLLVIVWSVSDRAASCDRHQAQLAYGPGLVSRLGLEAAACGKLTTIRELVAQQATGQAADVQCRGAVVEILWIWGLGPQSTD